MPHRFILAINLTVFWISKQCSMQIINGICIVVLLEFYFLNEIGFKSSASFEFKPYSFFIVRGLTMHLLLQTFSPKFNSQLCLKFSLLGFHEFNVLTCNMKKFTSIPIVRSSPNTGYGFLFCVTSIIHAATSFEAFAIIQQLVFWMHYLLTINILVD